MMKSAVCLGSYALIRPMVIYKCFEVRKSSLISGIMMVFPSRISLSLKPIVCYEPQGPPEGMVGSFHFGDLIQPIWFCSDSISEEERE